MRPPDTKNRRPQKNTRAVHDQIEDMPAYGEFSFAASMTPVKHSVSGR
jgi:hypothetical protein